MRSRRGFGFALALLALAAGCGETHSLRAADGGTRSAQQDSRGDRSGRYPSVDAGEGGPDAETADATSRPGAQAAAPVPGHATNIVVENVGSDAIVLSPDCGAVWVNVQQGD